MGRGNQPRDRRGRWTTTGRGASLSSQRNDFARALQHGPGGDNSGRSTVYAYLRDKDSPSGKAGSPYYVGVAGSVGRPYMSHGRTPVPQDERRIRMLRSNMTHEQAREWEKFYIQKYGRRDIGAGRKMLINHTDGGEGVANPPARTRAKIAASLKGRAVSVEVRAKLSEAGKGRAHTPESRAKISKASKGRSFSAETRAKLAAASKNMSPETRAAIGAKVSVANKGKTPSAETRAKISESRKGIKFSAETRRKMSEAQKGKTPNTETRAKISAANRGKTHSAEVRAKISAAARTKTVAAAEKYGVSLPDYEKLSKVQRRNLRRAVQNGRQAQDVLSMWRSKGSL